MNTSNQLETRQNITKNHIHQNSNIRILTIKCMTKMENFARSRKVAHILKVWSLLSAKIPISSR
jgi:hypothetical protein